jgi:hypothetical protein
VTERSSFTNTLALALLLSACNVTPLGTDDRGAVVDGRPGCPGAALVVLSDYLSTQVAVVSLAGETLSESLISTASLEGSPLSFPLSGDVVLPSSRPRSGRAVLIDRYGTNVLTFVDPESAEVLGQLPVGTGFESNPQDYLELDGTRALVSRFGQNPLPGSQPFDAGGDLLVIDTHEPEVLRSITLAREGELPPRPGGMTRVGDTAVVSLGRMSFDFKSTSDAVFVGIDIASEAERFRLELTGLKNCGTLALAPGGRLAAAACSGAIDRTGRLEHLSESGLVLFDVGAGSIQEIERFSAATLAGEPIQSGVEFASESSLLLKTQTVYGGSRHNRLLAFEWELGVVTTLSEAPPDEDGAGRGVTFGGMLCAPGCGDVCLIPDAGRGELQRFSFEGGLARGLSSLRVERTVGLPPRQVGGL